MEEMFHVCSSYTGRGIEAWDTSSVKCMTEMFFMNTNLPPSFQQDISSWNVGAVKRHGGMFACGFGADGIYEEGPWALAAAFRPTFSTADSEDDSDDESSLDPPGIQGGWEA